MTEQISTACFPPLFTLVAIVFLALTTSLCGCSSKLPGEQVRLITLNPGHFHSALVQKSMYSNVDPVVHVYAPDGDDVAEHLKRVESYNTRATDPTRWQEVVYRGPDYLQKMLADKSGNVVVISGNNAQKADYILKSVQAGMHVLADKPMAITPADFEKLKQAFKVASERGVLLYDIMTERFEPTNALQIALSKNRELFGELLPGSATEPAVQMHSVHYFSKVVSGTPLKRPAWFFDVRQQGSSIVDVATHLVDLAQLIAVGEQVISPDDVTVTAARRWPTSLSREQFQGITGLTDFPQYLKQDVADGSLNVFANGDFTYQLKGVWIRIVARWDYQAKSGGDTHDSIVRGSKATLRIRQGPEQAYRPVLYVEKEEGAGDDIAFEQTLKRALDGLQGVFPGVVGVKEAGSYRIAIPESLATGHEAHFAEVTRKFLNYLSAGTISDWEIGAMITKYSTVIRADELSQK